MNRIRRIFVAFALLFSAASWAGPVNVNTADAPTLMKELVGIGEKRANAIIAERTANGPYKDVEDLRKRVSGIGPKTIERNLENLKFAGLLIPPLRSE